MKLNDLSGDSSVESIDYAGGEASIVWTDHERERAYRLRVATPTLLSHAAVEQGSVHARLVPLERLLDSEPASGLYTAPNDFGRQMQAVREGGHLALGLKASAFPLLLQIRGYELLFACPLGCEESIRIEEI